MKLDDLARLRRLRDIRLKEADRRAVEAQQRHRDAVDERHRAESRLAQEAAGLGGILSANSTAKPLDASARADIADATALKRHRIREARLAAHQRKQLEEAAQATASLAQKARNVARLSLDRWDKLIERQKHQELRAVERQGEYNTEIDFVIISQPKD
jgi:hypothetical protein